uniref:hypothetical protein n=1 Tax=Paenibacillus wynnii TaxID=268407 RepID=UPI0027D81D1A|nr:hypothetical protein [Paenibacillus wynnii]
MKGTAEDDGYMGLIVVDSSWFKAWETKSQQCLMESLQENSYNLKSFNEHVSDDYESHVTTGIKLLEIVRDELQLGRIEAKSTLNKSASFDNIGLSSKSRMEQASSSTTTTSVFLPRPSVDPLTTR